jgi:phenylacetate-CoA ligase
MTSLLLRAYHQMPAPMRSVAASLRGYYLHRWRYGEETEALVEAALERDRWSAERWREWQLERVSHILHLAATKVPYYRQQWEVRRRHGDRASWEVLENWPILNKAELRKNPQAFVSDEADMLRMFQEHTSGTTGTPLTLWCRRDMVRLWYALSEARWHRWYDVSLRDRWAIIGGQQVVPFDQMRPPFWVWNSGLRQLYMSSLHVRADFLNHYLDAIKRYQIAYLYGYSSALYWLALQALEIGFETDLKVVITNAEPLYDFQREVISKAFKCPVRETYGLGEMVCAMSECEHEKLHLWPETGLVELLGEDDQPVERGVAGRLVSTGLMNEAMPLIRYESMDMAQYPASDDRCSCGRGLPLVEKVIGRLDDAIITRDGRRLALLDIIFGPDLHVKEAQLIQETLDCLRIKVVPSDGWGEADERKIRSAVRMRTGELEVLIETVPHIERTWAGKFRVMISKLPPETKFRQSVLLPDINRSKELVSGEPQYRN